MIPSFMLNSGREVVTCSFLQALVWRMNSPGAERVGRDEIGGAVVTTSFVGIDLSFGAAYGPWTFETLVQLPDGGECKTYYRTWADAEKGHARAVHVIKKRSTDS